MRTSENHTTEICRSQGPGAQLKSMVNFALSLRLSDTYRKVLLTKQHLDKRASLQKGQFNKTTCLLEFSNQKHSQFKDMQIEESNFIILLYERYLATERKFQNTESSCLMRLLGPGKSRISQTSHQANWAKIVKKIALMK